MQNNIKRLPDAYYKKVDGNNFKLLNLNEQLCQDLAEDLHYVFTSIDLFTATGKTLDLLGQSVDLLRGKLNDEQYRQLIQNRIYRNTCNGGYSRVVELLAPLLNTDTSKINFQDTEISGTVELLNFTLEDLNHSSYTAEEVVVLIEALLPVGVRLSDANFEGSFEFGEVGETLIQDLENSTYEELSALTYADLEGPFEYNPSHGFGNEEQTIGGDFGLVIGDSLSTRLPL